MRPIVLKLLQQEPVTQNEWQELFYSVHLVCLWDDNGGAKVKEALKEDISDFIKEAQKVIWFSFNVQRCFGLSRVLYYCLVFQRVLSHQEDQALLKAYIAEWRKFFAQCDYLPTPFRQVENANKTNTGFPTKRSVKDNDTIVRKVF